MIQTFLDAYKVLDRGQPACLLFDEADVPCSSLDDALGVFYAAQESTRSSGMQLLVKHVPTSALTPCIAIRFLLEANALTVRPVGARVPCFGRNGCLPFAVAALDAGVAQLLHDKVARNELDADGMCMRELNAFLFCNTAAGTDSMPRLVYCDSMDLSAPHDPTSLYVFHQSLHGSAVGHFTGVRFCADERVLLADSIGPAWSMTTDALSFAQSLNTLPSVTWFRLEYGQTGDDDSTPHAAYALRGAGDAMSAPPHVARRPTAAAMRPAVARRPAAVALRPALAAVGGAGGEVDVDAQLLSLFEAEVHNRLAALQKRGATPRKECPLCSFRSFQDNGRVVAHMEKVSGSEELLLRCCY